MGRRNGRLRVDRAGEDRAEEEPLMMKPMSRDMTSDVVRAEGITSRDRGRRRDNRGADNRGMRSSSSSSISSRMRMGMGMRRLSSHLALCLTLTIIIIIMAVAGSAEGRAIGVICKTFLRLADSARWRMRMESRRRSRLGMTWMSWAMMAPRSSNSRNRNRDNAVEGGDYAVDAETERRSRRLVARIHRKWTQSNSNSSSPREANLYGRQNNQTLKMCKH